MTEKYGDSPNHVKLRDSDRVLENSEPDVRGWPVQDEAGNSVGTVSDLLLNTDTEYVDAIALEDGSEYPIDYVEIGSGSVLLRGAETATEGSDAYTIQRAEEELRAGTREREVGAINVRKKVETEREQLAVPKRREEVSVERVPAEAGTASEAEIGDNEVVVPVTEEEVVVDKRPVVKEELRIRKDVVEDEEVVEEDVRREEIDIDDATEGRKV